jgi:uroporphyrinogen decarboxylase
MVSPKHTARFIAPSLKQVVDYCHSRKVPCLKHTDGNIWNIFEIIIGTGVDAIHPIDPLAGMDLGEVKVKYGDKLCLMGNVDCGELLSWGTKEEVREIVKDCIRKAGKGGGYICMSSNVIHAAVNPENYIEMVQSVREYGRYPLCLD